MTSFRHTKQYSTLYNPEQTVRAPHFISSLENRRRQGTLNQGISYEGKICALFALRFVSPRAGFKNFWIIQNIDHPSVGNFDDVIIQLERNNGEFVKLCIQLKHFGNFERRHKLKYAAFHKENTKKRGPFHLLSYYKSVEASSNRSQYLRQSNLSDNIKYILFTNKCKEEGEERFVPYFNEDTDLINTGGAAFQFKEFKYNRSTMRNGNVDNIIEEIDKNFLEKLVILCGQENEENLLNVIGRTLQQLFKLDDVKTEEVVAKYISHITNWMNGNCGGNRILAKNEVTFKLGEFLINHYVYQVPLYDGLVSQLVSKNTTDLWNQITKKHKVVLVENTKAQECSESVVTLTSNLLWITFKQCTDITDWSVMFSTETMQVLWSSYGAVDPKQEMLSLWGDEKVKKITLQTLHYYLWKTNVLPLVLRVETEEELATLLDIVNFTCGRCIVFYSNVISEKIKRIIKSIPKFCSLVKGVVEENDAALYSFANLSKIDKEPLLKHQIVLQGRKVPLNNVLQNQRIMSKVLASHIANILVKKFSLGSVYTELPEIFMNRSLNSIIVDPVIMDDKRIFVYIIICKSAINFREYIEESGMKINKSEVFLLFNFGKNSCCSQKSYCSGATSKNSFCKIPINHKIILINSNDVETIQAEIAKPKQNEAIFNILEQVRVGNRVQLLPLEVVDFPNVNVVITKREYFYALLRLNFLVYEESEVYELEQLTSNCLPVNCRYLISPTEIDLCFLRRRFSGRPIEFHFYKLNANYDKHYGFQYNLELLGPLNNLNYIKKWKMPQETRKGIAYNSENIIYTNLNIISGSPGMGKSVLLNHLSLVCPSDYWFIQVNLNDNGRYFYNKDLDNGTLDHLKHLASYSKLNEIEQNLVDDYLLNKRICLFFDGFDEIDPESESKLCEFIQQVLDGGFLVFISTRPVKVALLETYFDCMSRRIMPFTEKTQLEYIKKFYNSKITKKEAAIHIFVKKLLGLTAASMTAWDKEFAEIPLQTKMISEIYLESCRAFCKHQDELILQRNDVLDIYEKFIELKIKHVQSKEVIETVTSCQHFQHVMDCSLKHHMECALVAIFGMNDDTPDVDKFILEIQKGKDKIGLIYRILEDGSPVFVHRTFAEFLVASYFSRNYKKGNVQNLLLKTFENPSFYVIRNIFDRLLCRDCKIHLALLNRDESKFSELLADATERNNLDWGGRSVLHLAMSWGARHQIPDSKTIKDLDISYLDDIEKKCYEEKGAETYVEKVLQKSTVLLFKKDQVFDETPLFYGIKTLALQNVDLYLNSIWKSEKCFTKLRDCLQHLYVFKLHRIEGKNISNFFKKQKKNLKNVKQRMQSMFYENHNDGYSTSSESSSDVSSSSNLSSLYNNNNECVISSVNQKQMMFVAALYDYSGIALAMIKLKPKFYNMVRLKVGKQRQSLLHVAALSGAHKMIHLLLKEGLDINVRDADKETVIHLLSRRGQGTQTLKLLLEMGANVNVVNKNKWSALLIAARRGNAEVVRLLLLARANVNATDNEGWTVLRYVREQEEIRQILAKAGALENLEG